MLYYAHRGNINGRNLKLENTPEYILAAIKAGFFVEADIWFIHDKFLLGHDKAQYNMTNDLLLNENILWHAKNKDAFERLLEYKEIHCFWHQDDSYTLTSKRIPVIYPGKPLINNCILMDNSKFNYEKDEIKNKCFGVCSDIIYDIKKDIEGYPL